MMFTESFSALLAEKNGEQLSLDDILAKVENNADEAWKRAAMNAIRSLCSTRRTWNADDLWEILAGEEVGTHEPRALGAIIVKAVKEGLCRSTGRYEQSRLPVRHRRPVAIWESCEPRAELPS